MKRVLQDAEWTLFSPDETPELHALYGKAFEQKYCYYEEKARAGDIKNYKIVSAKQLWRKMLTRLFETGHPWITFKDPCNVRSPQDHVGVIHSSNLCTEVTLNTSEHETAVCNLGSINVGCHIIQGQLDRHLLHDTINTALRMLDNVIDLTFYPTVEAHTANIRHRPVGLGLMGFQDALFKLDIPFMSQKALEFADMLMETISYYAIHASCELARERGAYSSYKGSKWDRGIFPLDTIELLEAERGMFVEVSRTATLDWESLKARVKRFGMRNSNVMAIAPTATISTITGCYPCIEPIYENIYVKANVSGEFTIVNKYLVHDLKKRNLWTKALLDQLKYHDGDLSGIAEIPDELKEKYKTCFEIDPLWLIKLTAVRSKWIDQSQSHNVFVKGVSGAKLSEIYLSAWKAGLKTAYYLRTLAATQIEKSTLDAKQFGVTQIRQYATTGSCSLDAPADCESCQ
jgi:ribonucleoside-diphosphate reductase alpha chain